jgi:hypothetical protein
MPALKDLRGQKFGQLTVLERAEDALEPTGRKRTMWQCHCVCGNSVIVPATHLSGGNIKSCGCWMRQTARERSYRHGMTATRTYWVWSQMIGRCTNPKQMYYSLYGGRGIKVCDRWLNSFEAFYEDMGECPDGLSIDRINNDGDYKPENCRWATPKEQARNRKSNRILTWRGETRCLSEWSERLGISRSVLHARISLLNWDINRAFTEPVRATNSGKQRTVR